MRKVLLVCYYFPPMGGAGVARPLALVKHLPEYGYECHVLTVKPVAYRMFEPDLLENIPDAKIYRAGSFDPQRLMYLLGMRRVSGRTIDRGRTVSNRYFPDAKIAWVRRAVKLGRDLLNNRDYHAVISTSPPMSAHLAARQLSREFKRPWIADFRDYWAMTVQKPEVFYRDDPGKLKRAQALLADIRDDASLITAVNGSVGEYVGAGETVYNCFDADLSSVWRQPSEDDTFGIGLLGTLNDITPVEPLLRLLARVREAEPVLFDKIRLRHVGQVDPEWIRPQLEKYGLADKCELLGAASRHETVRLLSATSMLYIGVASEREAGLSTGRIYTMLSSGRPILAAAPHGSEIEKLVSRAGNGCCFFDEDRAAIAYVIERLKEAGQGGSSIVLNPSYATAYSSRSMAAQFAGLLDRLQPPTPR